MRSNKRLLSVFDAIPVTTVSGTVSAALVGDYDRNGKVSVADVMGLFSAIMNGKSFSADDYSRVDVNQDGRINVADVMAIYAIVMNGR